MQLRIILVQETKGSRSSKIHSLNRYTWLIRLTAAGMISLLLSRSESNYINVGYCHNVGATIVPLGIS